MDASLGKLDGLELQVASVVGYSQSSLWKMDDLETQLRRGNHNFRSKFGVISSEINELCDSVAPIRAGVDELTFAYNGTDRKAELSFVVIKC
jgi:hypothetical protein